MKKIISMGFTALMIVSVFAVLDIVPIGNVKAELNPPHDDGMGKDPIIMDNIWNTDGDWVIESGETRIHSNKTIIVNGNLTIWDYASLTLRNVTLFMNCSYNGEYFITVKSPAPSGGGLLIIEDLDGDPSTVEDASIITSYTPDGNHRFGFVVEGINGAIQMRNSELHECGWDFSEIDYSDGGLRVSNFATIENNEISNCWAGIILYYADDQIIEGNYIHDCTESGIFIVNTGSVIPPPEIVGPNNTVTNCYWGINVESSTNINIHNNTLLSNGRSGEGGGLGVFNSDNITIQDNNITANEQYSLDIENSDYIKILQNELNGSTNLTYLNIIDDLQIKNNYICQGGRNITVTYFLAWEITNLIFENNVVSDNVGIGALFQTVSNFNMVNNYFENNPSGGFGFGSGSFDGVIEGNTIRNNGDMGLHLVANNIHVRNNLFQNNGDGTPYMGDPDFQDCGMDVMEGYDISIYDNEFIDNVRTTGSDEVDGICLYGSGRVTQVSMWNNTMDKNQYNLHCRGGVEAYDTNSTYIQNTSFVDSWDVYLERSVDAYDANHVTFLNTTFDNSSVYVDSAASGDFTCKWFKHILTFDSGGFPVRGQSVWVNDSNGDPEPSSGQPFITDAEGRVEYIPLTEYIQDSSGKTFYTPHSVEIINVSTIGYDEPKMWHSHYNTFMLQERPTVTDLYTEFGPTGSVLRTKTITIIVEGFDNEDINSDLIPHIEFRVNETSVWVNETSPYFGTWTYDSINDWWTITFTPSAEAELDFYGFRVRLEDTNGSYSDWYVVDDMVQVLNNPPNSEDIIESSFQVYRGYSIDIWADASDIEDIDEDNLWDAELQYRLSGSAVWETTYITASYYDPITGNWTFEFSPPGTRPDPNYGPVDFRVRFQDTDGDWSGWYQELDLVDVLNNMPSLESFTKDGTSVYRGDTIRVYADVSDLEEMEGDLYVHFYYTYDGLNWVDDWLSTPLHGSGGRGQYNGTNFFVEFSPPLSADLGIYEFRVYISDSDGGYVTETPGGNTINVKNNLPQAIDLRVETSGVTRGESIYIYTDATDFEDDEDDLIPNFEYMAEGGDWEDEYLVPSSMRYTGGSWRITFSPPADSNFPTGMYDFRVWFEDMDGDTSNIITMVDLVDVKNAEPMVNDLNVPAHGYRLKAFHITANGTDTESSEGDLTPSFEYKSPSGDWTGYGDIGSYFQSVPQFVDGYWRITFYPPKDAELGQYSFRVNFSDNVDTSPWTYSLNSFMLLNNLPEVQIDTPSPGEQPSQTLSFSATASDAEDATLSYNWNFGDGNWSNEESPTYTYEQIGTFTVIVTVTDDDEDVDQDTLTITILEGPVNEVPTADDLTVPSSGYRLQTVYISANGSDIDGSEIALIPTFEYKGPQGDWIKEDDTGTYFTGSPQYISGEGYWRIGFLAPKNASLGSYSFRVRFSDQYNTSEWLAEMDIFTLMNNNPEVHITDPSSGEQPSDEVTFTASASDAEDAELSYIWNFGDGETSEDVSPMHKYKEPGTYTVTLTVTDDDGSTATDTITIEIKEEEITTGIDPTIWVLSLLPLIVAILILLWFLAMKKKKKEEEPPSIPEEAEEEIPTESEEDIFESDEEFDSKTTETIGEEKQQMEPEEESYDSKEDLESESSEEFDEEEEIP